MSEVEDLKRTVLLLDAQVRHLQDRLRSLEPNGRKIFMLPIMVRALHPVFPLYPTKDYVLLAVTLEENETQSPVIMVTREALRTFLTTKIGDICKLDDYQQTPHIAHKKFVPKEGWIWECYIAN